MTNINAQEILIIRIAIIPNQWCRENLETIQSVYFELQISTQKSTVDKILLVLIFQIYKWAKIALLSSLKGKGLTDWRCTKIFTKKFSLFFCDTINILSTILLFLTWQYNHLNTASLGLLAHFSLSMLGACWQLHLSTITEPRPDSTRGACAEAAVLLLLGLLLEPDLVRETQKTSKFTSLHLKH